MSLLHKKITIVVLLVLALSGSFLFGVFMGYERRPEVQKVTSLFDKESALAPTVDFGPFWKVWNLINEKYVSSDGPTDQEKVWGAISGLVRSLDDPYSVFLPPEETEMFQSDISGEFQGVGMEIGVRDNIPTVIAPLKNTPAQRAGILPGDRIIKIDDAVSVDLGIDEAVRLIRGTKGTTVKLTILREGEEQPLEISIVRDIIEIPTIDTETRTSTGDVASADGTNENGDPEDIYVLRLYNFSANSPYLFRESLRQFVISGKHKLILDLRGNPGGYLEAAVDMASWFLPVGKVVVREDFGKASEERVYRSRGYDIFGPDLKMVILVNGGSASASEILAGALSEHGIATLVGTKTFGKGSVQELLSVTDDTALKVTVARWLTPEGTSISEKGIVPDVEVEVTKEEIADLKDPQMQKAIEILAR
ncbi:MAG: S41 family peptidase [Patescibacteria group bacterium]|nr:S41 family peptidase [Patescibacteria group bacterium]